MLTRFAPSPTGFLHIGNARTALLCWLFARQQGGKFILRIDDTDEERSRQEYVDALMDDLSWLGLTWDAVERQSQRLERYEIKLDLLRQAGRVYECFETPEELDVRRKMQLSRGAPPIYDRAALKLSDEQKKKLVSEGRKPHYRFLLEEGEISWNDAIKGEVKLDAKHLSDPIVMRENGSFTYMLPSAIDDIDMGITHVLRGEDHLTNTAVQIQMMQAMDAKIPTFAHNALLKTAAGKISKREGGMDIRSYREKGILPMAINSFMAAIGSTHALEVHRTLEELIDQFSFTAMGTAPAMFDPSDLDRLNIKLLHGMSLAEAQPYLAALSLLHIDENFWLAVRGNINTLHDVGTWWDICEKELEPVVEDKDFTMHASKLLPEGELNEGSWDEWMKRVKLETDRSGKALFMPIRKALTGMEHGPELKYLLPLLGRYKIIERLNGKAA